MRPVAKAALVSPTLGLGAFVGGLIALAIGQYRAAPILAIYPGSFLFYLLPASLIERCSEGILFWVGVFSAIAVWALLSFIPLVTFSALNRRATRHMSPN
jgi:hypothetical protein